MVLKEQFQGWLIEFLLSYVSFFYAYIIVPFNIKLCSDVVYTSLNLKPLYMTYIFVYCVLVEFKKNCDSTVQFFIKII